MVITGWNTRVISYPVVMSELNYRSELGVSIFPTKIPYEMGSHSELLKVFQPSNREWEIPGISYDFGKFPFCQDIME